MRTRIVLAAVAMVMGLSAWARPPKVGETVEDFTLMNVQDNQAVSLSDFKKAKGIVLMFIATQCPVSNDYNERMVALYKRYKDKGIQFVGINSNRQESIEEIQQHAKKHGFEFPILKDVDNKIADRLGARVTPEIYFLGVEQKDGAVTFRLLYHGWIDDNQNPKKVTEHTLQDVLDAFLAGKPLPRTETKAFGCTIKRVKKKAPTATP